MAKIIASLKRFGNPGCVRCFDEIYTVIWGVASISSPTAAFCPPSSAPSWIMLFCRFICLFSLTGVFFAVPLFLFCRSGRLVFAEAYVEVRYMVEVNLMTRFVQTNEFRSAYLEVERSWRNGSSPAV